GADGKLLGIDPETGLEVTLRSGRFGPYVQLGEAAKGEKPKRASIPKGFAADEIDLEKALLLLSLPREVGVHPETGKPIKAGIGRYGPFVEHEGTYANLESVDDVFTVGLNRAVTLLAEKAKKGGGRGGSVIKELGEHPSLGGKVQVMSGRYGPYVKHGKINATLPKNSVPEEVTLEEAVALIAAKAEKGGKKTSRSGRKKKSGADAEAAP
ncbi:MAG: DNA topoisomerase I, partial [Alphaproteobacteria bacterium]